ncbi:MAG: hypothetical protein RJA19_756 [Bacteroidota bacterium]
MTYAEAVEVLFGQLPMFQREGAAAYKVGLEGTQRVLAMCGNPEVGLAAIHVAGTNGKGSVCHQVAAVLQEAGYKAGLFTSPHLLDFRERIRINGVPVAEEQVVAFVDQYREVWGKPSFFELTWAFALHVFRAEVVDIAVVETGMGGRLDSTNILPRPLITAVTNVGLDHQAFLGPDVWSIAREKAGIFKEGVPVVLGKMRPEAQSIMLEQSLRTGSEVHYAAPEAMWEGEAPYAAENRATARKVLEVLDDLPGWKVPAEAVERGLRDYKVLTGQRGRWTFLPPTASGARVLVDCAHNIDGLSRTVGAVRDLVAKTGGQLHVVFGTVSDKSVEEVLPLLPSEALFYWCAASIPRAMGAEELERRARACGFEGRPFGSVSAALDCARAEAGPHDLIWVTGSIFVVAEVLD